MRYLPIILLAAIALLPVSAGAHGAVIVIIDGLGSSYLPSNTASYASGGVIEPIELKSFDRANAQYQLKVPAPATGDSHAVIVTGYSNASGEVVSYYHATFFDALKDEGYLTLGILENGDSKEMLNELDAVVCEKNGSIYNPCLELKTNGNNAPKGIIQMMEEYPRLAPIKAGKDPYSPYIRYNSWALGFARDIVQYMNESGPGRRYILMVNAGGLDSAGQNTGYEGYKSVLSGLDSDMEGLIDACDASDTLLVVTGDHGMSFPDEGKKGSHSALLSASRNESLLVPLLIYSNIAVGGGGIYGQECLAPTLLSLLDEPNTMSLSDGEPLPVKEKPTLYLASKDLKDVTVTGPNFNRTSSFSGLYRIMGLEKGNYTVSYDGTQRALHLDHDELLALKEEGQSPPAMPSWMVYLAVAFISVTGTGIALKLAWMRK